MSDETERHLFGGYGIELEYVIVNRETLDIMPISDTLLRTEDGEVTCELDIPPLGLSNEFVLHVIELKTNEPVASLSGLAATFRAEVARINRLLEPKGAQLLPAAMHPWMDPRVETRLWPHGNRRIYQTYDRIFGCRSHGWANIQSMQLNLPFCGDEEFGRLHAAVRLLLPLMPALAAASPVVQGKVTGLQDTRLEYYRGNQRRVPSVTGEVIPEPVYTVGAYNETILKKMYREIALYDPDGILQHEWLNSRGAIPRFDRSAIEIRVLDVQERPEADLAIAAANAAVLKALVAERWSSQESQAYWPVDRLVSILRRTARLGKSAVINDVEYLNAFGFPEPEATAGELWRHLLAEVLPLVGDMGKDLSDALALILDRGTLSQRILGAVGQEPSRDELRNLCRRLCRCLVDGEPFCE